MRGMVVAAGVLVVLTLAACGGGDNSSDLMGVPWRWTALLEGEATSGLSAVPDPRSYLLTLDEDGTFGAKADCNSLGGTYSLSGDELTLEPGPMTMVACGARSLSDEYVASLRRVKTWEIYEEGQLALGFGDDLGYMYFSLG